MDVKEGWCDVEWCWGQSWRTIICYGGPYGGHSKEEEEEDVESVMWLVFIWRVKGAAVAQKLSNKVKHQHWRQSFLSRMFK